MKLLVVVVIVVGLDRVASSTVSCSYYCTRSVRYTTGCGLFNWWRCTRYRAEGSTCYRTGVNGAWSSWLTSDTGSCSVTCGLGTRVRTDQRHCNNPAPTDCGAACPGNNKRSEYESCNAGCCPVSGGWSDWELQDSSTCSVTCGGGTRSVTYQRTCSNPATSCGGVTCSGSSTKVEEESCGTENCPEDGGWSPWYPEKNGSCSVTCGEGELSMTYVRHCDNPAPQFGGKVCEGNNRKTETFTCNTQECPIDGGWSSWYMEKNESCSVTCGGGEMNVTYRRRCDSPSPQYGGSDCTGDDIRVDTVVCNTQPCPIHGGWSSWYLETTSSCSVTCGVGELTLTYRRHCDSPAPQFGGSNCTGDNTRVEIIQCSTQSCPVDGRWSDWSQWHKTGECSALCGGGQEQQVRERECNNPAPASGGRMCDGDERENRTITCNHDNCADRCPQDSITFIAHTTNNRLYYQCDNGVAVLRQCGTGTVWDQLITTCVHDGSQQSQGHEQKTECDPTRVHQPHPSDCTKFLLCSNGQVYEMTCPDGLYFSDVIGACDWATSVTCERA
ncbi:hemicentin-1-like isoform X2 [Pomacea canaliculata]|uniref:hemicentin-1-like isoform X2 n=1 Tax=Pomacea canaliculata TaxID=400727 RepID=UPI000D73FA41|nr:hemicentin-1-like isoform X2 [Pomacea canaliculata]